MGGYIVSRSSGQWLDQLPLDAGSPASPGVWIQTPGHANELMNFFHVLIVAVVL
jgi:hypothetical protein